MSLVVWQNPCSDLVSLLPVGLCQASGPEVQKLPVQVGVDVRYYWCLMSCELSRVLSLLLTLEPISHCDWLSDWEETT